MAGDERRARRVRWTSVGWQPGSGSWQARKTPRTTAANALVTGFKNDGELAKRLISSAQKQPENQTGVYNSVVVLNGLSQNALAPHKSEVETFLKSASRQGERTANQAQRVEAKLRAPEMGAAE